MTGQNFRPLSFRRHRFLPLAVLILSLIAGIAVTGAQPTASQKSTDAAASKPSREWQQAQSANFVAVGDAGEGPLRTVLTELEAFRWAFLQMFPSVRLTSPVPTTLVIFRDWESFTRFQPRDEKGKRQENVGGYFMPMPDANYMIMGAQGTDTDAGRVVVFHEFAHHILHRNLFNIPAWLDEGLAEYYSTLRISKDQIIVGAVPPYRVAVLRNSPMLPLEKLLSTQEAMKLMRNPTDMSRFYAEAWALVHYVTLGDGGKRRTQISSYMNALQRGLPIEEAFKASFGCTYDEMERDLRSYVHRWQFPAIAVDMPRRISAEIGAPQPMTEVDAEAFEGGLFVRAGAREDAEKKLQSLLARQPSHASARLSLALLRLDQERRDEAIDLLRQLTQADSTDFAAHVYLAPALVEVGQGEEAVRIAERATILNQQSPAAWSALALAALVADRQSQADAAMTRVMQLDPQPGHYRSRAYDAFRLGKDAAAARDASAFIKQAGWGDESAPYLAFLAALAHRRLKQPDDADRVLEQARTVVQRGSWTEKVLDFFQGRLAGDQLVQRAKDEGERTEAHTYVGFHDVWAGRSEQAIAHFRWVKQRGTRTFVEYRLAVAELARLEK